MITQIMFLIKGVYDPSRETGNYFWIEGVVADEKRAHEIIQEIRGSPDVDLSVIYTVEKVKVLK